MIRCILPCAGYGTRVGMKPHEAKEMLPWGPNGETLIEHKINLCRKYNLEPFVITRLEKLEFNRWLASKSINFECYKPTGEWAQTIHDNRRHFNENEPNILMLPDTEFPEESLQMLINNKYNVVFATHIVKDTHNWGIIHNNILYEKPRTDFIEKYEAWGLIKFDAKSGRNIFGNLAKDKHVYISSYDLVHLKYFKDLTR